MRQFDFEWVGKGAVILDFDMECRPLAWYGGDFVTKQPTVIAWKVIGSKGKPSVAAIGLSQNPANLYDEEVAMLEAFRTAYNLADIVTGHYIRGFDLTLANGAFMRLGLPLLGDKMAQDTKTDLAKKGGLSSSQENLGAMFELDHPKVQMNTTKWARGNMLILDGIKEAMHRCVGDVEQHIEMRAKMLSLDLLRAPAIWSGKSTGASPRYES